VTPDVGTWIPCPQNPGAVLVASRILLTVHRRRSNVGHIPLFQRRNQLRSISIMPEFMDVHRNMVGITQEALRAAHDADLEIQSDESVDFKSAWADPESGLVYCLSEAPSADAVRRIHERAGHPADEVHPVPIKV
jgi:hypothetical protein